MKTVIPWISVNERLPNTKLNNDILIFNDREMYKYESENYKISDPVWCLAQDIENPDYTFMQYLMYIENWNDFKECESAWVEFDVLCVPAYYDVFWWCDDLKKVLPRPIIKQKHILDKDDKKYTLRQLRQAWGAGFYQGTQKI